MNGDVRGEFLPKYRLKLGRSDDGSVIVNKRHIYLGNEVDLYKNRYRKKEETRYSVKVIGCAIKDSAINGLAKVEFDTQPENGYYKSVSQVYAGVLIQYGVLEIDCSVETELTGGTLYNIYITIAGVRYLVYENLNCPANFDSVLGFVVGFIRGGSYSGRYAVSDLCVKKMMNESSANYYFDIYSLATLKYAFKSSEFDAVADKKLKVAYAIMRKEYDSDYFRKYGMPEYATDENIKLDLLYNIGIENIINGEIDAECYESEPKEYYADKFIAYLERI